MHETLHMEICPETGICSIIHSGSSKIDLMPDEVDAIRDAAGDVASVTAVLNENDSTFTASLSGAELELIGKTLA